MKADKTDIDFMKRALALAGLGLETTLPNPAVGCVIIKDDEIIAEGWHKEFGGPHAEVEALNAIPDLSVEELKNATAYVTLEPCSHFGKTPPCADLLIKRGVGRVVTAMEDPNPKVSGRGHKKLTDAGVDVSVGVLEGDARKLNRQFLKLQTSDLPYVTLKWAQSADGFIDPEATPNKNRGSYPISSSDVNKATHRLRARHKAILVGRGTAEIDNPRLTLREGEGENPMRLIIDPSLKINPSSLKMLSEDGETYFICNSDIENPHSLALPILGESGLEDALRVLRREKGVFNILVEGGSKTHQMFIDEGLWDEAWVVVAEKELGGGLEAPVIDKEAEIISSFSNDVLKRYFNHG